MNPFKQAGFDSIIAKGTNIAGSLFVAHGSTTQIDGEIDSVKIELVNISGTTKDTNKTTLVINGKARSDYIEIPNVTITGEVDCDKLIVHGVLAIKKGSRVKCGTIKYRTLVVETGAIMTGAMEHLDARLGEDDGVSK